MWATIIYGLATVASAVIMGLSRKRQGDRARREARSLSEVSRKDEHRKLGMANRLSRDRLNLNQEKLDFEKDTAEKNIALQKERDRYDLGKASQSFLKKAGSVITGKSDESWLYKDRLLGRFA